MRVGAAGLCARALGLAVRTLALVAARMRRAGRTGAAVKCCPLSASSCWMMIGRIELPSVLGRREGTSARPLALGIVGPLGSAEQRCDGSGGHAWMLHWQGLATLGNGTAASAPVGRWAMHAAQSRCFYVRALDNHWPRDGSRYAARAAVMRRDHARRPPGTPRKPWAVGKATMCSSMEM